MSNSVTDLRVVSVGSKRLTGILRIPTTPHQLVIFAHGAGSSRLSSRNNMVAEELGRRGIATLLFDLLTEEEATDRANVFDMSLLAARLVEAIEWARTRPIIDALPISLFGSSTGAAAALLVAAEMPHTVKAVVSRGGRVDMAEASLPRVRAPVLLIVGGADTTVLELNKRAASKLTCPYRLEVVPGATHLFEEPGALGQVITLAGDWFEDCITGADVGT